MICIVIYVVDFLYVVIYIVIKYRDVYVVGICRGICSENYYVVIQVTYAVIYVVRYICIDMYRDYMS